MSDGTAERYMVLGCKPWNRRVFDEVIRHYPGAWTYMDGREELTPEQVSQVAPRYLFFLHWSWIVPEEIVGPYECVGFHMTDLPYGRGGSPLQNLIVRGHRRTVLTALRMVRDLDAGPVYLKKELSLEGSAEEILIRASHLAGHMIRRIITEHPDPIPQSGEPVVFQRRRPEQSRIPRLENLQTLYDFIRMLDAEGYPRAFLEHEGFRFEFCRAALRDGRINADVAITPCQESQS